jgi:putative ABC transport system permease protein
MLALDSFLKDLKHSLRMFRQNRAFTLTAIAALTLGIGANTAVFSVVNAVLLRPVPFPDPDRLVFFQTTFQNGANANAGASPAKFAHFQQQDSITQDAAAFRVGTVNYTGGSFPEQVRSGQVSSAFFHLFGASPILGRTISPEDDRVGGGKVVVLSQQMWERRFNSDPQIVGRTISLGGDPHTVIGVLGPFDFADFGQPPDVWTAFQLDPNTNDQGHYFQSAGRLKPGVTLEQAKQRMQLSVADYNKKFPNALQNDQGFTVQPLREAMVKNVKPILFVLIGAVSFVLLIACANVANLLLVRATGRAREIAIRAAIGAGRWRIVRQLLTESVLLSLAGGLFGLLFGYLGIRALLAVNTAGLPRVGRDGALVGIDWRVLSFTLLVAVGTGIIFGLFPALQSSRSDLSVTLKESSGRSGTGFRQNKARSVLVVVEVALALVLLIGSALLIRTALALRAVDPGFDTTNILTMRMALSDPRFQKSESVALMVKDAVQRLKAVPGVVDATATCCVPLEGGYGLPFIIQGRPLDPKGGPFHGGGGWLTVSPGYFETFKIAVKKGRTFNERDDARSPGVVIINESMAKRYWPNGGDPLVDRLVIGKGVMREFADEPQRQIIGVVSDVRDNGLNNEPGPKMYVPQAQLPDLANALNVRLTPMAWVVKTQVPPMSLSTPIQEQLRQATGLPVSDIRAMDEVVLRSISRDRFNMWLMTVFGFCALLLAAIGIYGLMAYSVEQRTQEIGIRLALGAEARQVKNMVVRQGMVLAAVGLAIGIAGAFYLALLLRQFLFRVEARDPIVFVGIPVLLGAVALLAVWIPARRASRVDPIHALRYE